MENTTDTKEIQGILRHKNLYSILLGNLKEEMNEFLYTYDLPKLKQDQII